MSCNFLKKFLPFHPTLTSFYSPPLKKIPPQSYIILHPGQLNSYIISTPLNKLPPHSCTILPPDSPALTSFHPLWIIYPLTLTTFYPLGSPARTSSLTPSLLQQFSPFLGSPAVTSFYTLWTNYPLVFTPFYPRWKPYAVQKDVRVLSCNFLKNFLPLQPHPYIILPPPPLKNIPTQSHVNLPPLNKLPPHSCTILPPGSPALTSFYPLWTIYALTLTPFYTPLLSWQPSCNLILPHLNKLPPHSCTILPPGSPAVTSFYPLWTIYALTLTPFYTPLLSWQPSCNLILPLWTIYPLNLIPIYPLWNPNAVQEEIRVLSCNFLKNPSIAAPPLHHFNPPPLKKIPTQSYIILAPLNKLPSHSCTILPPWQSSSNPILPPLNNFPSHSFNILPPLNQLTPHYYTILPRWKPNAVQKELRVLSCNFLKKFLLLQPHSYIILPPPLWKKYELSLTLFNTLWTNYPSLLHHFTPWQSSSNLILPPLNNLPSHPYNVLPPLAAQLLPHFKPSEPITPHYYNIYPPPLAAQL